VGVAIDGEWVLSCARVKRECVLRVREGSRNFLEEKKFLFLLFLMGLYTQHYKSNVIS